MSDFQVGDLVVYSDHKLVNDIFQIQRMYVNPSCEIEIKVAEHGFPAPARCWAFYPKAHEIRRATPVELAAKHRIDATDPVAFDIHYGFQVKSSPELAAIISLLPDSLPGKDIGPIKEAFEKWLCENRGYTKDQLVKLWSGQHQRYLIPLLQDDWELWQHQQGGVDSLILKIAQAEGAAKIARDEKVHAINRWSTLSKEKEELQKRVEALEYQLKKWKGESVRAMLHGFCSCGEPRNPQGVSGDGQYALFECPVCHEKRREYCGEQAPGESHENPN